MPDARLQKTREAYPSLERPFDVMRAEERRPRRFTGDEMTALMAVCAARAGEEYRDYVRARRVNEADGPQTVAKQVAGEALDG